MISLQRLNARLHEQVAAYHGRRLHALQELKLSDLLKHKNPYLLCSDGADTANELVTQALDDFLAAQRETLFGNDLVDFAKFIAIECLDGHESTFPGIDLEFTRDDVLHLVTVKSGPQWDNHRSRTTMKQDFAAAVSTLQADGGPDFKVVCINGICYGRVAKSRKPSIVRKLGGKAFWEFLSGDPDLFLRIVDALHHDSELAKSLCGVARREAIGKFTTEFERQFSTETGAINWRGLVEYISGQ